MIDQNASYKSTSNTGVAVEMLRLDVAGHIHLGDGSFNYSDLIFQLGESSLGDPATLSVRSVIGELMTVLADGNIGISNISPTERLTITGGNVMVDQSQSYKSTSNLGMPVEMLQLDNSGDIQVGDGSFNYSDLVFNLGEGGLDATTASVRSVVGELMTILEDGNIGISNISPTERLDVRNGDIMIERGQSYKSTDPATGTIPVEMLSMDLNGELQIGELSPEYSGLVFYIPTDPGGTTLSVRSIVGELMTVLEDGNVGIGTIMPEQKLHLENSSPSDMTGIKILNTASVNNQGWKMGHIQDATTERDGAFVIMEDLSSGGPVERITALPITGNIGINELIPDTKLHVSRDIADPGSSVSLIEGTGIMVLGPITKNVVADYRGIQARTGVYVGSVLELSVSELNLQRLGGDILIHGDAMVAEEKSIITSDAKLGLGTITPAEKIDIDGAIKIGTTTNSNEGTIRYNGTDFEGRTGSTWVSFSAGSQWEDAGPNMITYNPAGHAKVGIGVVTPTSALHVSETEAVSASSIAAMISNTGTTSSLDVNDYRAGLNIQTNGTWGSNADAKNIGLYISNVSGQSSSNSNIAAVMNGNVVVGDLTGSNVVGADGVNVLAIQNGAAPSSAVSGVQIYSDVDLTGVSVVHVMNGDGTVIKLYSESALPVADPSTVDGTYSTEEETVINNMRDRINSLETKLQNLGLLIP